MEDSILISTKKILGIEESYLAFDLDIVTHINTAFSTLYQLGLGPDESVHIEDSEDMWSSIGLPQHHLSMVRTYVFLKVRQLFDPPSTSYLIEATNAQIQELEWRLNTFREVELNDT